MCMVCIFSARAAVFITQNLLPSAVGCDVLSVALAKNLLTGWKAWSSVPFRSYTWTRTALSKGRQLRRHHQRQANNLLVKRFIISVYLRTLEFIAFFPSWKLDFFFQFNVWRRFKANRPAVLPWFRMKCL